MRCKRPKLIIAICVSALAVLLGCLAAIEAGRFLVVNRPEDSNVIVVLFGDVDDIRIQHGLVLLRKGYAQQLIFDAPDVKLYGRNQVEEAKAFLREVAPDQAGRTHVCSFSSSSTRQELVEAGKCIRNVAPNARSGIIVTSNFHTRRAFEIARCVMPQYRWSVAAASDPTFDSRWWLRRDHSETAITEWQKLLWWAIVEQWTAKIGG
jgi:uncharacterized SAM-binding protein YcdF (DUF218 family)